jgi:hypothetical protein
MDEAAPRRGSGFVDIEPSWLAFFARKTQLSGVF